MHIVFLSHSLNPQTGAGVLANNMIDGVRKALPDSSSIAMTSEDLLSPQKLKFLLNLPAIMGVLRKADIIHALDGFPYGVIAALLNVFFRKPLIISPVGTGAIQRLTHPFLGLLLRWAYNKASQVTVPSKYIAQEISKVLPELNVIVINFGIDPHRWDNVSSVLPQDVKPPYILSVGAIKRRKGYEITLPAFARLKKDHPNLSYVIVGKPEQDLKYFRELQVIIKNEGIEKSVHFVSGLTEDELGSLYKHAEVFVLMPQNVEGDVEGFGLVFLEAASVSLPSVSSLGTAAEDPVKDGVSGILVSSKNVLAVASAMEKLIYDKPIREKFKNDSRNFALSMSWQNQIEKYIQVYRKIQN